VWTQAQADAALGVDVMLFSRGLDTALPWWRTLDLLRQDVLLDMSFNLGIHGLLSFGTFLGFVKEGEYPQAALDLRGTPWFHQVGERAVRLCDQLATGLHVAPK
jgi:lysozyme